MNYRVIQRQRDRLAAARAAKERKRLAGGPSERAPELPHLRRKVIVIDYDHGMIWPPCHWRAHDIEIVR